MGRYSRQILFKGLGEEGQERIQQSSVVLVGLGAIGSVTADILARAGVGSMRLIDRDYLEIENLQRQSLYTEEDIRENLPKAVAAERALKKINSEIYLESAVKDVNAHNIRSLLSGFDLILDGNDNFETRFLINEASVFLSIPWIYAACLGSYAVSMTILPGETPCLNCLFDVLPKPGTVETCETAGIIAPASHLVATLQSAEALKFLSGRKEALRKEIVSLDLWSDTFEARGIKLKEPDKNCLICGKREFKYLGEKTPSSLHALCQRNAVQIFTEDQEEVDFETLAPRLERAGKVSYNRYLLRFVVENYTITLFKDGRAIIKGTADPALARSVYSRFIGN